MDAPALQPTGRGWRRGPARPALGATQQIAAWWRRHRAPRSAARHGARRDVVPALRRTPDAWLARTSQPPRQTGLAPRDGERGRKWLPCPQLRSPSSSPSRSLAGRTVASPGCRWTGLSADGESRVGNPIATNGITVTVAVPFTRAAAAAGPIMSVLSRCSMTYCT